MQKEKILVWLPSPLGDAILCTPALRAIRQHFESCEIYFFAKEVVREVLSPSSFCDHWLGVESDSPLSIAAELKKHKFARAIVFKNSFASGLAVFLARIPVRVGYCREWRGMFLSDKLHASKLSSSKFKPTSMVDYYLAVASWLGADTSERNLELLVDLEEERGLMEVLPAISESIGPIVIIVPGGAFGPSKCWASERYSRVADWLIDNYNATVVVSVAPVEAEKKIASEIVSKSRNKVINLGEKPISLGKLKALFSIADLVISNDTGPRHIAIALGRKIVTLFGPNNPEWTETGYENEIKIVGEAPCVPCDKPTCDKGEHLCMESISVEAVCRTAKKLLDSGGEKPSSKTKQNLIEVSESFFVDAEFKDALSELGMSSVEGVFSFSGGENLTKKNLAEFRERIQFETESPGRTLFLKRYSFAPVMVQLKNWISHRKRVNLGAADFETAANLAEAGINTPRTVSYGQEMGKFFEKKSFIVTEKIPDAESLEKKLPGCFTEPATIDNLHERKNFINQLASFIGRFHKSGYRHRDLYLCHIFYSGSGEFYLIDLARAFRPKVFSERYRIKDIAQLYYSAPKKYFSRTERMRFYLAYIGSEKLSSDDKAFIGKVKRKARRMARHDVKHGRGVPFSD
ncbi:MAG: lipopolysaccharide heptosyltransferase II [Planctomycetes bacterium]|nr:lipopolysaccharide heptosyltransferase II [Planctomycetota bacterium]